MDTAEISRTALLLILLMMKAVIITAMDKERRQVEKVLDALPEGQGTLNILLRNCGIGKVNAAAAVQSVIDSVHPDFIISAGVAGGLKDFLAQGDVVIGSRYAYHDVWCGDGNEYGQVQDMPAFFEGDASLVARALEIGSPHSHPAIHPGLICTGDKFSDDRDVLSNIRTHFPEALAVDMESAAMAQVCHVNGVPFVSFRIISNLSASEESCLQYRRFWEGGAEDRFSILLTYLKNLKNSIQ